MPRSALNFIMVVFIAALFRFFVWHLYSVEIGKIELWSVLGLGVTSVGMYQFLPELSKKWFSGLVTKALTSSAATKIGVLCFAVLLFLNGLFSVVEIRHNTDVASAIFINGKSYQIPPNVSSTTRRIGFSFQRIDIACGSFTQNVSLIPFSSRRVEIPFDALVSQSETMKIIELELVKTFFQFYESDFFLTAKDLIKTASNSTQSKLGIERIAKVQQVLELAIMGPDPASSREILIADFEERFPSDRWVLPLKAASQFCSGDYLKATSILGRDNLDAGGDFGHALIFFRGVCFMRAARATEGDAQAKAFESARRDFRDSEVFFSSNRKGSLSKLALPSSIVFQAILSFYEKNLPDAKKQFERAASVASGSMKARALNGKGYVEFIEGSLAEAEVDFQGALRADPTFAYARSNYGYVLLARDAPNEAIGYFDANASDTVLAKRSPRDVLLAKLAKTHAQEALDKPLTEIVDAYGSALRASGFRDFAGVVEPKLRLAHLYCEIAERVYLGKDYYGLEPFALALFGKALAILEELPPEFKSDPRVTSLQGIIKDQSHIALRSVSPEWLNGSHHGAFFSQMSKVQAK